MAEGRPEEAPRKEEDKALMSVEDHFAALFPNESAGAIAKLLSFFVRREAAEGEVLWRRGGESTASEMVFLEHGELLSELDESDSHATEMVHPGNIMGDYSFLASEPHTSTVTCRARCTLLVLDRRALDTMLRDAPQLAFALAGLTIRYLGHRTARVSNRIWESHCVPV